MQRETPPAAGLERFDQFPGGEHAQAGPVGSGSSSTAAAGDDVAPEVSELASMLEDFAELAGDRPDLARPAGPPGSGGVTSTPATAPGDD